MAVVTNRAMTAVGEEGTGVPSNLPFWTQETLDDYLTAWAALTKEQRRASRELPAQYVRTPHGIFNRRRAEHVQLPDPPPDEQELKERAALRAKKTRI